MGRCRFRCDPAAKGTREYRTKLKERRRRKEAADAVASYHGNGDKKKDKPRTRPFTRLLAEFWGLLRGFRGMLLTVLIALASPR